MTQTRKLALILLSIVVLGGVVWSVLGNRTSGTEVTVEVLLHPSGTVITDLAQIDAFETFIPDADADPDDSVGAFERYGAISPVEGQPNVFQLENGFQAGFVVRVGATDLGMITTTGGGAETRNITFPSTDGLVRLTVQTDGAPEVFVQAASDPASGTLEAQSQGLPEDGQMVFLLPPGDWTFSAVDDALDQSVVVTVPEGDIVEATLDLRAGN